jgi:hypothetical protein
MARISSWDLVVNCIKYTFFGLVSLKINYTEIMKLLICCMTHLLNNVIMFTYINLQRNNLINNANNNRCFNILT